MDAVTMRAAVQGQNQVKVYTKPVDQSLLQHFAIIL